MGEIRSSVELETTVDRGVFDRGHGEERAIRGATVERGGDTGAATLALPQTWSSPGLEEQETAFVTYAHERRDERLLAGLVTVRTGNCAAVTHCTCGLTRNEPLIGQVVLETLDLTADCTNRTLTPHHSDYPLPKLKATALAARQSDK